MKSIYMEIKSLVERLNSRGFSPLIASVLTIMFGITMLIIVLGVVVYFLINKSKKSKKTEKDF